MQDRKAWLNNIYTKTKQNQKLENKFFGLFQILYLVCKQVYKLEILGNWIIHNVFYVSLLKQNTSKKGQVNRLLKLELEQKLHTRDNDEY